MSVDIETTRTKDKLLISIPTESLNDEEINDFLSVFKAEIIARKSRLTGEQADEISEEIKSGWWTKNKSRIEKMIAENE